ncbi:MAG: ABC transporter permease [Alphaproteobacteria bacterium]|nr:MAG: ABC transporter permease [Alphaproteobacteria bacterium]
MSPLDRKLARDLWRIKGQAAAIGAVIAVGVMLQVMMSGLIVSLGETRDAYYSRYRMADIFAPLTRAPDHIADRLAAQPGVSTVQTRVTGRALIHIPTQILPIQARAISLPDLGRPALNDVYLADGRMPEPGRRDEILLLRSFAVAHGLHPGERLDATMNGARRSFRIVGLAQSPEFLYPTPPGEFVPDDARFAVIWMRRAGIAAAFDMKGAFNEALLTLARGADEDAVLAAVDRVLKPYGGSGSYARADQLSNRYLSEEIGGLRAIAVGVPPVFLAVAAFLLYIVIGRMVQAEREEIGLLKAFGYGNTRIGVHYFKLILIIATVGAGFGCLGGIVSGRGMVIVYTHFFKFPFLVFQLDPASFVSGVTVSILAASAGGLLVLRRVFALTPSEAMRPPAPPSYRHSGRIGAGLIRFLDQPSRMIWRRLTRQPARMLGASFGIASGMALSAGMLTIYAGFDRAIELTFAVLDRSKLKVSFVHPVGEKTLLELARLPGVDRVEPVRYVPVILRNGQFTRRGALTGLPRQFELNRALDADMRPIRLTGGGIVLSSVLARLLAIRAGETLRVEVREGRQPVLEIPVVGIAETLLGTPAYMDLEGLNRKLREPGRVSGAALMIDEARRDDIYRALKGMPVVAGISLKDQARRAFQKMMDQGAGATRFIMGAIAFVITFGIVYNAARIAYAERARDLASLRVMGFTRAETAYVLLGELAVVTLMALPLGTVMGYFLSFGLAALFSTDLYQIPAYIQPASFGQAMLVVIGAAIVSGWLVKRDLDRTDLISALKTRE